MFQSRRGLYQGPLKKAFINARQARRESTRFFYKLLKARVHVVEAVHTGTGCRYEHQAIISRTLWDKVHWILSDSLRIRAALT
jgi:site-specific DNA recombinase